MHGVVVAQGSSQQTVGKHKEKKTIATGLQLNTRRFPHGRCHFPLVHFFYECG